MTNELRKSSLTFWGLVFFAITVIFPAGPFAVTGVTAMDYSGKTAPLAFLIGGLTLFLAIIAVYIYTTRISNAGGYYKFVEVSVNNKYLSKSVGFYYLFWVIGDMIVASIVVGWFLWVGLQTLVGYSLPLIWVVLISLITPVVYLIVGIFSINLSQKIAIIMGIIEIAFFVGLSIAILVKTPYNGAEYFNIGNSLNGLHGFFLAMVVGAFLAYGGYGSIVVLGEEAKLPLTSIKKAVVVALLIMIAYDTLVVYANVAGAGPNLGTALQYFAPGLYLTKNYFGFATTVVAFAVVEISQLMSPVLFGNSGARALYAMARDGVFPKSLAKVHPKYQSPYMAVIAVFIVVVAGIVISLVSLVAYFGEDNGLFDPIVIFGISITIFTLLYHIIVNQTLAPFMYKLKGLNIPVHIIAPTAASVIMGVAIYYSLIGLTWPLSVIYIMIPAWIIISLVVVFVRRGKVKMDTLEQYM